MSIVELEKLHKEGNLDSFKNVLNADGKISLGGVFVRCADRIKNEPAPTCTCVLTPSAMLPVVEETEKIGIKAAIEDPASVKPLSQLVQDAVDKAQNEKSSEAAAPAPAA